MSLLYLKDAIARRERGERAIHPHLSLAIETGEQEHKKRSKK